MNKKYLLIALAIVSAGLLYKRSVRSMEPTQMQSAEQPIPELTIRQYVQQHGMKIDEEGTWNLQGEGITSLEGLDQLEQLGFDPGAVKELELYNNRIQEIPRGIFAQFYNLEQLFLSGNRISIIYGVTEHGVQSLRALARLRELGEAAIQRGSFSGLVNLKVLSLGENQLKSLPVGIFLGLVGLQRLGLSGNPLGMTRDQIKQQYFPVGSTVNVMMD